MRHTTVIFLCLLCHAAFGIQTSPKDSLLLLLPHTTETHHKANIYRHLADIYFEHPQERHYLKLTIQEAKKSENADLLLSAYSDLTDSYIKAGQSDSARIQLDLIKDMTPSNATKCQHVYLSIRLFDSQVVKKNGIDAIHEELKKQADKNTTDRSIFYQIKHAYNVASALEIQKKYIDAIPYINTAVDLASTLPPKEGSPLYVATMRLQQRILQLSGQYTLLTPLIEKYAALQETHYQKYLKNSRPFYPIDGFRIANYTPLIMNIRYISSEKAPFYLQKIIELSKKSNRPTDKYRGFLAINNYYLFKKEYSPALAANDSLIKYAHSVAPYLLPYLHGISSQIQEAMGLYKDALQSLRTSSALQDSISSTKSSEQLNELKIQYDLNKLNHEKSQLEIENKLTMLVFLSFILSISILISIYLYQNLQKEKAMQINLRILKTQAEESEKIKTVFVNSICHEIRTPLNSIVGFTDLLFDESIDEQTKQSFPEEIQKNTRQLTGLVKSMLEVSSLDVSDEKLPCTMTDISTICQTEMDLMIDTTRKIDIKFHLNIPQTPSIIPTHEQYLSLVIENLLQNASKFTQSGDITLEYHQDKTSNKLQISVTDTGCGIPLDKQKEVFERFVKLNAFVPGNGLGLYLCQLIVKRLSGTIAIEPNYTQGTRVVVELPLS